MFTKLNDFKQMVFESYLEKVDGQPLTDDLVITSVKLNKDSNLEIKTKNADTGNKETYIYDGSTFFTKEGEQLNIRNIRIPTLSKLSLAYSTNNNID